RVDNVKKMAVTLDHIDENVVSNRDLMCTQLTETLGINVQTFEIKKIDYVRDVVEITVVYQLPSSEIPQYSDNIVSVSELVIDSERAPKTEGS
ncbi:MAG: DUF4956 domain-containing protein, partial [Gammaproteobacteria bacterium]|nr:DUF4956 domain-containing protein [Gammaproteobacteria bacterium]MBT4619201.1 DUF4956 domain-containing protein [Gammaproteobacteria bacterium]MBT7796643.1 DUF4956 domain-containing protein [Gammaproteobacteria bacterium]